METIIFKKEVEPMLVAMGKYIRQKRISLGLSQEELAARSGLHRTYISDVERGIRNLTIGATWFVSQGLGVGFKDMFNALEFPTSAESPAPVIKPVSQLSQPTRF